MQYILACSLLGLLAALQPDNSLLVNMDINSVKAKAKVDTQFVCVTMDWWPPEKCDYGTCAWGNTGVLNNDFS